MTFGAQALSINVTALERNLPNIADNPAIAGQTPVNFNGFGLKANAASPDDIAYFFSDYAKDNTTATGINIVLNSQDASSGGYQLALDIIENAGDNGYLEEHEVQAWADKIGFTGNIRDVMTVMSKMDDWLYGAGVLELVPESEVPAEAETSTTTPDETTPDETTPEETTPGIVEPNDNSLLDVIKGGLLWLWDGIKGAGSWLFG